MYAKPSGRTGNAAYDKLVETMKRFQGNNRKGRLDILVADLHY